MNYDDFIKEVENGSRYSIDFIKKTAVVGKTAYIKNGEVFCELLEKEDIDTVLNNMDILFHNYFVSRSSQRSDKKRKQYFFTKDMFEIKEKGEERKREKRQAEIDFINGENRMVCCAKLELYFLMMVLNGSFYWKEEWDQNKKTWFYVSPQNKYLIIRRDWL